MQDADTQLSAMAYEFELNEEMGVKQRINKFPRQESPSSSAFKNADFGVKDKRENCPNAMSLPQADVPDAVVHLEKGHFKRITRTPARYQNFRMGNRVGGQRRTDNSFPTGPKSVKSVHFSFIQTYIPRRNKTKPCIVVTNSRKPVHASSRSIVLIKRTSELRIDKFVRLNVWLVSFPKYRCFILDN